MLPLYARFYHITGHKFESLIEVMAKLHVRPVKISNKGLESIQLPKQILGGCTAVTANKQLDNIYF